MGPTGYLSCYQQLIADEDHLVAAEEHGSGPVAKEGLLGLEEAGDLLSFQLVVVVFHRLRIDESQDYQELQEQALLEPRQLGNSETDSLYAQRVHRLKLRHCRSWMA